MKKVKEKMKKRSWREKKMKGKRKKLRERREKKPRGNHSLFIFITSLLHHQYVRMQDKPNTPGAIW
jgi:intein/homing endonuclease